ncbi:Uncharacterised protein [Fusobacterium nucleatum]|nr:Uncharacterised protein [Fusobacterium nucleatum]
MESLLSLLNEYELFNNIFPGIIFLYFSNLENYIPILNKIDIYEKLLLYYFIGLIISRIGSLFLEPFFLKLEIIKFADYSKFLKAEEKDNKIHILVLVNNMYRSFCIVFLFSFLWLIFKNNFLFCSSLPKLLTILFLFFLFIYSYRKQTEYIRKRIENNIEN